MLQHESHVQPGNTVLSAFDVAESVRSLGIAPERVIIQGNGALQCYQVARRQPTDIDLVAEETVFSELYSAYRSTADLQYTLDPTDRPDDSNEPLPRLTFTTPEGVDFDVLTRWGNKRHAELLPQATLMHGVTCAGLDTIVTWKRRAYRPKDVDDLTHIEEKLRGQLAPEAALAKYENELRTVLPAEMQHSQHPAIRAAAHGRFTHDILFGGENSLGEVGAQGIRGVPFYRTLENVDALIAQVIGARQGERHVTTEQLLVQIAAAAQCTLYGISEVGLNQAAIAARHVLLQVGASSQEAHEGQCAIEEVISLAQYTPRSLRLAPPYHLLGTAFLDLHIVGPQAPGRAFYEVLEESSLEGAFGDSFVQELAAHCQSDQKEAVLGPIALAQALQFIDKQGDAQARRHVARAYAQRLGQYHNLPEAITRNPQIAQNQALITERAHGLLEGRLTLSAIHNQLTAITNK